MQKGDIEYKSFSEAAAFGSENWTVAVEKVSKAVIKLIQGSHSYERDGTAFVHRPPKYTLRDIIKKVWASGETIVDFGGGLGGTYLNNIDILAADDLNYIVIEQEIFCQEGTRLAKKFGLPLTYYSSLDKVDLVKPPKILIFSGVLLYIEHWPGLIRQGLSLQPEHIVIDRTPVTPGQERFFLCDYSDYYGVPTRHPLQTINEQRLISAFSGYSLVAEWLSDFDPEEGNAKGFHFVRSSV